jgi:nickel-dependent lactate racemase
MQLSRTIIKQKVAIKLFPDSITPLSAMQRLRREINTTPNLKEKLCGPTNNSRLHHFTNKQVKILLVHFDITVEEYLEL